MNQKKNPRLVAWGLWYSAEKLFCYSTESSQAVTLLSS